MTRYRNDFVDSPARQCDGKVRFTSKSQAKTAAKRRGRQGTQSPYRCPHCGWWHHRTKFRALAKRDESRQAG